jgi:hypothetical protein
MGGACGTYGRQEKCIQGFEGRREAKIHLKDLGVDGRLIFKWIFRR